MNETLKKPENVLNLHPFSSCKSTSTAPGKNMDSWFASDVLDAKLTWDRLDGSFACHRGWTEDHLGDTPWMCP